MNKKIFIFTLIKDEQRYLDEWIEYHLNIGVDKIIIFEDLNSNPHDISNYDSNKVILYKVNECFNKEDKIEYNKFKQKGIFNYFLRNYKNECDWSTCIDIDEFIECDNIQDVIKNNDNYAQITLLWKIYTYNGYIKDPAPNQKYSVLKTYKKFNYSIWEHKSLFNMHDDLIIKKWANQNIEFVPHRIIPFDDPKSIWSKYKIGHYYTKSFEEYLYNVYVRGRTDCWSRKSIDNFFQANALDKNDYLDLYNKYKDKKCKVNIKYFEI